MLLAGRSWTAKAQPLPWAVTVRGQMQLAVSKLASLGSPTYAGFGGAPSVCGQYNINTPNAMF